MFIETSIDVSINLLILCFILIAISLNCPIYTSSKVTVRELKTWKTAHEARELSL